MRKIKTISISILAAGLLAGTAVGVTAADEEAVAGVTSFTGVFSPDGEELLVEGQEIILPNGFREGKPGFAWQNRLETSDPRLTGDHRVIANWVIDPNGFEPWSRGEQANLLIATSHVLTNDGGSWIGEGTSLHSTDLDIATELVSFAGGGGYEGLTAFAVIDPTREPATISGVVYPTGMPEVPEPYTGE